MLSLMMVAASLTALLLGNATTLLSSLVVLGCEACWVGGCEL